MLSQLQNASDRFRGVFAFAALDRARCHFLGGIDPLVTEKRAAPAVPGTVFDLRGLPVSVLHEKKHHSNWGFGVVPSGRHKHQPRPWA